MQAPTKVKENKGFSLSFVKDTGGFAFAFQLVLACKGRWGGWGWGTEIKYFEGESADMTQQTV